MRDMPNGPGRKCRHGDFVFPNDTYIGKGLEMHGEYSEQEVQFLQSLLQPGARVIEVGANIGAITVPLRRAIGEDGHLWAFEPQADIAVMLEYNLEINGLSDVQVIKKGLGDKPSHMYYTPNAMNTGGVSLQPQGKGHQVAVETLDFYFHDLEKLDLLKIDVEGMETEVLRGGRGLITRCRPIIYLEDDRAQNSEKLLSELLTLNYRVWKHYPPLYNPNNFRHVITNPWLNVVSMNLICVPREQNPPPQVMDLEEKTRDGQWVGVCRFGGVGDNLVAASVLPMFKRQGYKVEMVTNKLAGDVFKHNPHIDKLSICEDNDQPPTGSLEWYQWFVKRGHEYSGRFHHLSHTIEASLAFVQAQCQFWWPPSIRRKVADKSYLELTADVCEQQYDFGDLLFYPSADELAKAIRTKAVMGPVVVGWVLGGSRIDKIYPQSSWAIARLIRELGVAVMMNGGLGKDFELAKLIEKDVEKQNGTKTGLHLALSSNEQAPEWPIRRSLTQLMTCDLIIGPDTGGMWAVAMAPMPKIMLLSHASPENITKHWNNTVTLHADSGRVPCWPCHRLHDSIETCVKNADGTGVACVSDISVETLIQTAKEALHVR